MLDINYIKQFGYLYQFDLVDKVVSLYNTVHHDIEHGTNDPEAQSRRLMYEKLKSKLSPEQLNEFNNRIKYSSKNSQRTNYQDHRTQWENYIKTQHKNLLISISIIIGCGLVGAGVGALSAYNVIPKILKKYPTPKSFSNYLLDLSRKLPSNNPYKYRYLKYSKEFKNISQEDYERKLKRYYYLFYTTSGLKFGLSSGIILNYIKDIFKMRKTYGN